ncbi:MAG: helix-turn-helix transcriptional regulator [Candidatus Omnitrophica bacterium]|nr:helix-turn-helix transcriptional regulator [Candidatus Omnitrophota bacterium]
MKRDWLWDRKISDYKVKHILSNPEDNQFIPLVSLLLARKNSPSEVLKEYISPLNFCRFWPRIKRRMRKDSWNNPRIEFWQAIYETVLEKLKKKGVSIKLREQKRPDTLFEEIGSQVKRLRLQKSMTQIDLAKKLNISQQMVSRIEKGGENISLNTLRRFITRLGGKIRLEIE